MYGNNYPNDYDKNVVDGTAREVSAERGNFSGQNPSGYGGSGTGAAGDTRGMVDPGAGTAAGGNHYGSYGGSYQAGNNYGYGSDNGGYYGDAYSVGNGYLASGTGKGQKKEKRGKAGNGYWKKALTAVSLGVFFGGFAGLGFFAVDSVTGALKDRSAQETQLLGEAAEVEESSGTDVKKVPAPADKASDNGVGTVNVAGQKQVMAMDVSDVAANVMPAIVSINNTYTQKMSYFGQMLQSEATSAGSGIIVGESDTELLIVSNYHVIEDADKLVVQFVDGTEAEAQMKGSDPDMDLAVVAVSLDDVDDVTKEAIAVATLGDSESLTVGEPAIAIGNALGYGQSVTVGVISALNRVIDLSSDGKTRANSEDGASFIQTDAAINPGNSGGALLNIQGEVIGINSNKIGGSAVEGMGYAIPISAAKPIIEDLMLRETRTKVSEDKKGYLGITPLTVVDQMAEDYGMPKGVYVSQVYEGTAAQAAGIVKGNIITEFDGNKISSSEDLLRVMEYYSVGDTVDVTIMQGSPSGWESRTVTVTLGARTE